MSATLHFMCGKMAAGKSTLARRLALEHAAVLICEDLWLQRLFPEISCFEDYLRCSERLKTVVGPHVSELLRHGVGVVLDFPANVPAARLWVKSLYQGCNAAHVLHWVDTPDSRCLQQLECRNHEQPEGSMVMTVEQFHHITALFQPPLAEEGYIVRRHCS